jgi:sRNA-binding regulator protein Hfq
MDWKDKFKLWLEEQGYTELINSHAIDELIRYVDIELLTPLKAELIKTKKR